MPNHGHERHSLEFARFPQAANKRQFSVFVNMSAACTLQNDAANIKKRFQMPEKEGKFSKKHESPSQR